jgi:hypothetical protein
LAIQTPVPAAPMEEKPNEILLGSAARALIIDNGANKKTRSTRLNNGIANLLNLRIITASR